MKMLSTPTRTPIAGPWMARQAVRGARVRGPPAPFHEALNMEDQAASEPEFLRSPHWLAWKACRTADGRPIKSRLATMQRAIGSTVVHAAAILLSTPRAVNAERLRKLEAHALRMMEIMDGRSSDAPPPVEVVRPGREFDSSHRHQVTSSMLSGGPAQPDLPAASFRRRSSRSFSPMRISSPRSTGR
ncbi:MAG: hypothetical protein V4540_13355 [Pseudomonadota bacterium]